MSQVKWVNLKIINFKQETSLNFSNCYNIEVLNFDLGLQSYAKFRLIVTNFFNKSKTDLILPQVFKEYDESSSDDNDYKPPDNSAGNRVVRPVARSLSQTNSPRQASAIIPSLYTALDDNTDDV